MREDYLNKLLNLLSFIALYKSMLPFHLRDWVNALGIYVQERRAGQLSRLQAGGRYRSYFDAWHDEKSGWKIKEFDQKFWERQFDSVPPTLNIAEYLRNQVARHGGLGSQQQAILNEAIERYKATGRWLWLPGVMVDLEEVSSKMAQWEYGSIEVATIRAEEFRRDSNDPADWSFLAMLYELTTRYKELEEAIKKAYDLVLSDSKESMLWRWHRTLGMFYFAALCNSTGDKPVVILGSMPSKVTAELIGYTVNEVRTLAKEPLAKTLDMAQHSVVKPGDSELKQLQWAIARCEKPIA